MTSVHNIDGNPEPGDEIVESDLDAAMEALADLFGLDDVFEIRALRAKKG